MKSKMQANVDTNTSEIQRASKPKNVYKKPAISEETSVMSKIKPAGNICETLKPFRSLPNNTAARMKDINLLQNYTKKAIGSLARFIIAREH